MRIITLCVAAALLALGTSAHATVFRFDTDPFADGVDVRNIPGRQIVGSELFINFSIASDVFAFDPKVFGVDHLSFADGIAANLPTGGANVILLENLDNDGNLATPFGAGNAANLIAQQVTTPGAGFFIYFNSALDLPRLVFSTDLDDPNADLKVLARMLNFAGHPEQLHFTADNFELLPEPSGLLLAGTVGVWLLGRRPRAAAISRK